MNRVQASKRTNADAVNRALALALRSPVVAAAMAGRAIGPTGLTRHGQRANPVPLTRQGKPNT